MKKIQQIVAAFALSALGASVGAQQAPAQTSQTFRSGVSLVTIDVTVLDKDGKPVSGLTADDIEIKLNGRVQPIRALTYVEAATAPAPAPTKPSAPAAAPAPAPAAAPPADAPRRTLSNANTPSSQAVAPVAAPAPTAAPPPPAESRVFILLVDDLSYAPIRGKAMFLAATRFLDRIPANDIVGFTTTSGISTVNPTRDRAVIRTALSKVVGAFNDPRGIGSRDNTADKLGPSKDQPLGISESVDIDRGDDSLLKSVIGRECYNGDQQVLNSLSLQQVLIENVCAKSIQIEARRVAALTRQNKERQIDGIKSVIAAMKTANGIRHLVLLTDGLPVSRDINDLNPLVRAAALAGVQLSVLLEDPDVNMNDTGRGTLDAGVKPQADTGTSRRRREDDRLMFDGAQTLSDMLGGTFYRVIGTPDPQFDRVIVASSAVYRLGVELPAGASPGKEFTVAASVKRPGVTVKANRFAVVAGAENTPASASPATKPAATDANGNAIDPSKIATGSVMASSPDDILKAALNSSVNTGDVPIRIASTIRRSTNVAGQVDVSVNVVLPASVKGPVTTFIGLIDPSNAIRSSRRVLEASNGAEYSVPFLFPLAPGDYRIRFVAADSTGAVGTIDMPVHASLAPFGPFTSSDVLTWVVDNANKAQLFAIEDVPAADSLNASIELYPAGEMPGEPPTIRWTLLRDGDPKPVAEDETPARPAATLMRADAEFPFKALPAGLYTVKAELIVNDKVVGTRAAIVRKK